MPEVGSQQRATNTVSDTTLAALGWWSSALLGDVLSILLGPCMKSGLMLNFKIIFAFFSRKLWKSLSQILLFPFNRWENRSRETKPLTLCMQLVLKILLIRFSDIRVFFCLFARFFVFIQVCRPRLCLCSWQKMLRGILHSWAWTSILRLCVGCLFEHVPIQEDICWDAIQSKTCPCCCELLSKNQAVRHILLCLLDFSIAFTPSFSPKLLFIYFSVFVRSCWLLYWVEIFIITNNTHLTRVNLFWAYAFIMFVSVFAAVLSKYRFAAGVSWIDSLAEKS